MDTTAHGAKAAAPTPAGQPKPADIKRPDAKPAPKPGAKPDKKK